MSISAENQRNTMVAQQVRTSDVLDPGVLRVLANIPREHFIAENYRSLAYADASIPLVPGRSTLTPQLEGRLLQALQIAPHEKVLEVGTGSGFITACLCQLADRVTSLDTNPDLTERARQMLAELGSRNCERAVGDLSSLGEDQKFDAIAVLGSIPEYDPAFQAHLKPGGRLFLVVGREPSMEALLVTRIGKQEWSQQSLFETVIPRLASTPNPADFDF